MAAGTELELIKLIKSVIEQGDLNIPLVATDGSDNGTRLLGPRGYVTTVIIPPSDDTSGNTDRQNMQYAHDHLLPARGGAIQLLDAEYWWGGASVQFTKKVGLFGYGGGLSGDAGDTDSTAVTHVHFLDGDKDAISVSDAGCVFKDFALVNDSPTTPTASVGIKSTLNSNVHINGMTIMGFYDLLDLGGVYYNVDANWLYDAVRYFMRCHSEQAAYLDHGDFTVANNIFSGWRYAHTAMAQLRWESGGGIKILGNKFNSGGQPGNASAGISSRCIDLMLADGVDTSSVIVTGNSISGWTSGNTDLIRIGQQGPVYNSAISGINITGNELTLADVGIRVEGGVATSQRIFHGIVGPNTFNNIRSKGIYLKNCDGLHIATQKWGQNCTGTLIDISDTNDSAVRALRVDKQAHGSLDAIDLIRDNRSFGNSQISLSNGVEYDYTRGVYISSNGVWQTQFVLTVPNGSASTFELDVDGQNTNSGHNSYANKGVAIKQIRAYDVDTSGNVTLTSVGTDVSVGAGSGYVAVRYLLSANTITVQVQTTDATQLALYGTARLKANGKLSKFHIGA